MEPADLPPRFPGSSGTSRALRPLGQPESGEEDPLLREGRASRIGRIVTVSGEVFELVQRNAAPWLLAPLGAFTMKAWEKNWTGLQIGGCAITALEVVYAVKYKPPGELAWQQILVHCLALQVFEFFYQVSLATKDPFWLAIPIGFIFTGLMLGGMSAYNHTKALIAESDFKGPEEPILAEDPSPFYIPCTEHPWKFYAFSGGELAVGSACFFAGLRLGTPGWNGLLQTIGALVAGDGAGSAAMQMVRTVLEKLNADAQKGKGDNYVAKKTFPHKVLIVVAGNLTTLQQISNLVSGLFLEEQWSFALSGFVQGAARQDAMFRLTRHVMKIEFTPEEIKLRTLTNVAGRGMFVAFAALIPAYTFTGCFGGCPKPTKTPFDIWSTMSITGSYLLTYATYSLIEYKWLEQHYAQIPIKERGKLLNTSRLLMEYSDPICYAAIVPLHYAKAGKGYVGFQEMDWISGYFAFGSAFAIDIARINDFGLTRWKEPQFSNTVNTLVMRLVGLIVRARRG